MDPMTPINPGQGRLPEIHLAPAAVQRITPDQQRNNPDDRQQAEEDSEVFEELLEEAEAEDDLLTSTPSPTAPGDVVAAADSRTTTLSTPGTNRSARSGAHATTIPTTTPRVPTSTSPLRGFGRET
jgi:hypothetical protein